MVLFMQAGLRYLSGSVRKNVVNVMMKNYIDMYRRTGIFCGGLWLDDG